MESAEQPLEFKATPELFKKLLERGEVRTFNAGSVIQNENKYITSIPIVVKGALKVIRTEDDGREILLYYIKAGESCVMSIFGGIFNDTSKVRAEVEEDSEVLMVPIEKAVTLIRENPQWLEYIFRMYHKRFEELLEMVNAVSFKKMDERLMDLLKKKKDLSHSNIINSTHEQIANELGTARVVISRLLKQLEDDGKLALGRNKITLL